MGGWRSGGGVRWDHGHPGARRPGGSWGDEMCTPPPPLLCTQLNLLPLALTPRVTRPAEPQSASKMATLVEEGVPEQAMRACVRGAQEGSSMMGRGGEAGSCRERASKQAGGWAGRQAGRRTCGQGRGKAEAPPGTEGCGSLLALPGLEQDKPV